MICLKHATLGELINLKMPLETKVYWVDLYDVDNDYSKLYLEYVELASNIFGVKKEHLLDGNRTFDIVEIRNIIWCVLNKIHNISTVKIGKLSKKNHATVLFGIKTAISRMSVDKDYKKKYDVFVSSVGKEINNTFEEKFNYEKGD
jgi:hypothetical protein